MGRSGHLSVAVALAATDLAGHDEQQGDAGTSTVPMTLTCTGDAALGGAPDEHGEGDRARARVEVGDDEVVEDEREGEQRRRPRCPGAASGKVTRRKVCAGSAPRSAAASSSRGSRVGDPRLDGDDDEARRRT